MTVYALIPVFNRLDMTRRMVNDLRAQRDAGVRIVVVDDGSTDCTAEWLVAQPDIVTIRGNGNLWWAGAVDAALRQILPGASEADYVLFLNNDTTIGPDLVATLMRVSRQNGGAAVGTALRDQAPPHDFISIGPRINAWHMHVWDLIDDLSPEERQAPKPVYDVDALSGRGTLYPVPVLRATGYLHPRLLPHYHADYELAARARRRGFETLVSTRAAVYTERNFGVRRVERSRWRQWFHRGSPNNLMQRLALWLLLGTPLQRATAIPRMLLEQVKRLILRLTPPRVRFALHASRLLFQVPFSGQARARVLMYLPPQIRGKSYNAWHAYTAGTLVDVQGKNVLVVGCNLGKDCAHFVRLGARTVHGLDVIEEVGRGYKHRRVRYLRASAEAIPVQSGTYDLVFCFATMEHVPDIERAFTEMARVTRGDGLIYSVASPLWNSRYGHHKGDMFERFPWIHLRMSATEITELCTRERIQDPTGRYPMEVHVNYMLNRQYFNMTPARRYVDTCRALRDVEVIENGLALDPDEVLTPETCEELAAKGYNREELLAVTHTFIGRKRAAPSKTCTS
jgi:GT2 family glycosyltransferase/SAM-dependent methyltransferase